MSNTLSKAPQTHADWVLLKPASKIESLDQKTSIQKGTKKKIEALDYDRAIDVSKRFIKRREADIKKLLVDVNETCNTQVVDKSSEEKISRMPSSETAQIFSLAFTNPTPDNVRALQQFLSSAGLADDSNGLYGNFRNSDGSKKFDGLLGPATLTKAREWIRGTNEMIDALQRVPKLRFSEDMLWRKTKLGTLLNTDDDNNVLPPAAISREPVKMSSSWDKTTQVIQTPPKLKDAPKGAHSPQLGDERLSDDN